MPTRPETQFSSYIPLERAHRGRLVRATRAQHAGAGDPCERNIISTGIRKQQKSVALTNAARLHFTKGVVSGHAAAHHDAWAAPSTDRKAAAGVSTPGAYPIGHPAHGRRQ